jgi:hypothetical protein
MPADANLNLLWKKNLLENTGTMPAKKFWPSLSVNSKKKKIVIRTLLSS